MTTASTAHPSELHLALDAAHAEILRSFIRETALAEGIPAATAGLVASDAAAAWHTLSTTAGQGRARASVGVLQREVRARLMLQGHARFADALASLGSRLPAGAGASYRESGIDGWEVSLHRSLAEPRDMQPPEHIADAPETAAASADDIVIDLAAKRDAPAIARCFLAVYGHHYVHSDVFSPRRYWASVEAGELIPAVARNGLGEVIGHVALEREAGALVAERGEAVVLPQYRGHHLLERMTDRLSEEAPKQGLLGIYAEPLTIHTFSQRNDVRAGMPVCAVLLGANPENFRPKDIACPTAGQRQSYLRTFRFVRAPGPRPVHAGGPYEGTLRQIYASLGVAVTAAGGQPLSGQSTTRISVNDRGYGAIRFAEIGTACGTELAQALRDVVSLGAVSVQLSARMADPGLPMLIDAARSLGFFFCGLGPGFAEGGEDLFLLQRLSEPLDTSKLQLFTEEAKQLVAFIEADRKAVAASE